MIERDIENIFDEKFCDYEETGKRIVRFCRAVSEINPTAKPENKIRCPVGRMEIESCLTEFETNYPERCK